MIKGKVGKERTERTRCEVCYHSDPWHDLDCPKAGKCCPECGARHPRHYPNCSQDIFGMGGWQIPGGAYTQRVLEDQYALEYKVAREVGKATVPPVLPKEREEPAGERAFPKDISGYLWHRILGLKGEKDPVVRRMVVEQLHADIDHLADLRDLAAFQRETA